MYIRNAKEETIFRGGHVQRTREDAAILVQWEIISIIMCSILEMYVSSAS